MNPRDRYLPGVPCWVDTAQPDPAAAAEFYGALFGWQLEDVMPPAAPGRYYIATLDGLDVAGIGAEPDDESATASAWTTYIAVEDADAVSAAVSDAGGKVIAAPMDVSDAGRMAVVADPYGAVFALWQAGARIGAQLVNAPGTVNFNDLSTPDVAGAKAFYGAVFGWAVLTVPMGDDPGMMWTLEGYGADLDRLNPGTLQMQEDIGAPPGFEDVVASLSPVAEGTSARWDVTFSVDDCDAVAARAAQLGGKICVEPFDAGPVRTAQLADPAGATLTISRFYPERLSA